MPASKAQQKAVSKYMKENYDVYQIRMKKGQKDIIKAHAEAQGESVNGFINRAIDHQISQDRRKVPSEAQQGLPGGSVVSLRQEAIQTAREAAARPGAGPPGMEWYLLLTETIEAAQEAAKEAGEAVPAFIDRAVEETADGDALPKEVIFGRAVDVVAEHYGVSCWDVLKELEGLVDEQGESR